MPRARRGDPFRTASSFTGEAVYRGGGAVGNRRYPEGGRRGLAGAENAENRPFVVAGRAAMMARFGSVPSPVRRGIRLEGVCV